jgi:ABC-type sugar transport system substrate-binding protein
VTKASKGYKTAGLRQSDQLQRQVVKRATQTAVFVITMASTLISFAAFGITWLTMLVVALAVLLLLSILMNVMYYFDTHRRPEGIKQIAFLTPASGGESFYATMLIAIIQNATLALGQDYIVIPSMPTKSFEAISIWALFSDLEDRQLDIDGIIFIPDDPDRHFDELVSFHEEAGDIPLVLVDVYFDLRTCDDRTRSRLPSFVGGDELVGGRLAAEMIIEAVGVSASENPVVIIINGGTAYWEQQRAEAVRERLTEAWPAVKFLETPPLNYSRSGAFESVIRMVRQVADSAKQVSVDAIFACNDDMAIGARAALGRAMNEGYGFLKPPQIIGYDGIEEIREYINAADPFVAGTVDVRIEEQAKAAMLLMHKLLRSGQRRSEVQLITPQAIRRHSLPSA